MKSRRLSVSKRRLIEEIIKEHKGQDVELDKLKFNINDVVYLLSEATFEDGRKYLHKLKDLTSAGGNSSRNFVRLLMDITLTNRDNMVMMQASKGAG